jgi:hypothetical protein
MRSSPVIRWTGLTAILAGAMYIAQALIDLARQPGEVFSALSDQRLEAAFVAALLLTLAGLAGIRLRQGARAGHLGTIGFFVAFIGTILALVSALITLAIGRNALELVFVLGLVTALAGTTLFGSAIIRAPALPRWCGAALLIGLPAALLLANYEGGIILSLGWAGLGYALWMERAATGRTSFAGQ